MKKEEFEKILTEAAERLQAAIKADRANRKPDAFESLARKVLAELTKNESIAVKQDPHPHAFPDIAINGYGVEIKSVTQDSWRSTANSIMETMRESSAREIYLLFGKMGGKPEVRWRKYEDCVYHVRISHAPRFCVEMSGKEKPLFSKIGISYADFAVMSPEEKMARVRDYARSMLEPGERLWWLEDIDHALEMRVRRFSDLDPDEKIKMRAEAAVLCPEIVAPSRTKHKYDAAFHYLISHHSVLAARDMFTAGSVGMTDGERGGEYIKRQFAAIENRMLEAFGYLSAALFKEYWGREAPDGRIKRRDAWLKIADEKARGEWKPSKELFANVKRK